MTKELTRYVERRTATTTYAGWTFADAGTLDAKTFGVAFLVGVHRFIRESGINVAIRERIERFAGLWRRIDGERYPFVECSPQEVFVHR